MISRKCDRCGKYFDMPDEYSDKLNPIGIILVNWFGSDMPSTRIDLCKDCMDELQEWIRPQYTINMRFPLAEHVKPGTVIISKDALDIGWVVRTEARKPVEIYAGINILDTATFSHYPVNVTKWYATNIRMSRDEWRQLSLKYLNDSSGWHHYWQRRLGVPKWGNDKLNEARCDL